MAVARTEMASGQAVQAAVSPVLLVFAALAALLLPMPLAPLVAVAFGVGGLATIQRRTMGRWPTLGEATIDVAVIALLSLARNDAYRIWQVPDTWSDLGGLTAIGSGVMVLVYGLVAATMLGRTHRHVSIRHAGCALLLPVLFNTMLLLGSDTLMRRLGFWLTGRTAVDDVIRGIIGRAVVLILFLEALTGALRLLVAGALPREGRLHLLLIASAIHAALTPAVADLVQTTATSLPLLQILVAVVAAAVSQAGLWATVFIVTGLTIDALGGRPPTYATAYAQWEGGLKKGAIYGGVFMALLLAGGLLVNNDVVVRAAVTVPWLVGILIGAALFPLASTVVASADGTPPFFGRLRDAYRQPRAYWRGAVVGLGVALALTSAFRNQDGLIRFAGMFVVGGLAYGGVDLAADLFERANRRRRVLETWRVYALGALLGGLVGGALGWYFDAAQIEVVVAKFRLYVALSGLPDGSFGVNPLFNKWGTIDLGHAGGGVKLFYDESLSGVINWSIAAPLFSINYFVLKALIDRSLTPLKQLISPEGFESLVEQAVRVLRWGLWMAPIINSFLRQSPDPSWYNQDGLVRTVAATAANATLPPGDFRIWSLAIFTGLLAYDWLRVIIWFDHMGLRVATLVNLTFLGGDRADEAAARFAGHAARTRIIPTGIRRFATWAPLLIPFYIPHGPEWDTAWTGAETIRAKAPGWSVPVDSIVLIYAIAALAAVGIAAAVGSRWDRRRPAVRSETAALPAFFAGAPASFSLSNGLMTADLRPDGRGSSSVDGTARGGHGVDIGKRMTDPLQVRGSFFFLRDRDDDGRWSVGYEPMRQVGPDYAAFQPTPACASLRNTVSGIHAEAELRLAEEDTVEFWRIKLTNTEGRPRRLSLVSFREIAVHELGAYARDPDFNALHVESWFVGRLNGLFFRNRLLRGAGTGRMSPEIYFHAVRTGAGAALAGYEDSRTRFLGMSGIRDPRGLAPDAARALPDEGSLYTFDPAASLTVTVDLPPNGACDLLFVTGRGRDEHHAAEIVAHHTGLPRLAAEDLAPVWARIRDIHPLPPTAGAWPFAFADDVPELRLTEATPRPWAHVLANANGFGTVVSNEGEIHSFNANARQNALTPFRFESVPTQNPGQMVYVVDLESGETDTAGFLPYRRADAQHTVSYRPGSATFGKRRGDTALELTVFVLPDGPADVRILKVTNGADRDRRFRVVAYFDMALDESAEDSAGKLVAERDDATETLLFFNGGNDFHKGWAFAATSLAAPATTTVRARFLGGAGRDLANPFMVLKGVADTSVEDDGRRAAGFSGVIEVPAGDEAQVVIVLGQTATRAEAVTMAAIWRDPASARAALQATRAWWAERLNDIEVETNDPGFDRLVNHWLPYQVLAARLWGRNGPNQRGGAYGFRDQLQDVLPFLLSDTNLTRRQIVFHAGAQFPQGDVFKWWHVAPDGRVGLGQRTRASDPHLWLPYVTARYLAATGDRSVLDERAAYLEGPAVPEGTVDILIAPRASRETGDVYDHCRRAIDYTLARMGSHGLPLVGTGDWNDGIDAAGPKGRGESLWMAFFFHDILVRFAPIAGEREGAGAAERLLAAAEGLKAAIAAAWTGDHFVFAYTDDGEILDPFSIMTSAWPALSGAVDPARARQALDHALAALEKPDRVLLLTPPFDENSHPYPGRIADYPPGVRENGGQYSHGASWTVDAYVALANHAKRDGDAALAAELIGRAYTTWHAISPLEKTDGAALATYGLAPHQQPADIYDGPGYAGRGGWSWYTGSAARMLSAAYAVIGLKMENGRMIVPDDLFEPRGELVVRRLRVRGKTSTAPEAAAVHEPMPAAAQ